MKKKALSVLLTVALAASLLIGCSSNSSNESTDETTSETKEESTESGDTKLYGITYWMESDFFKTIADSITEAAEADGSKTVVQDAGQDSTKQIQIIEDFIAQGVDAVFLNPVDKEAIEPALEKLEEAGIPVVNFDSAVANLDKVDAFVATDNVLAGELCAEAMINDFPDGGEIAVLNYPANSACVDREKGFLDAIEGNGFEVVATFDAEGTVENGQSIMSDVLQAYPDLVAVFCINDQSGMGAYAAIEATGSDAYIYGVDGNPDAKKVISQDGNYKMTAAQSPIKIGEESYNVAKDLLNGIEPEEFQIDVPAFTIDISNVKDYLDQDWQ